MSQDRYTKHAVIGYGAQSKDVLEHLEKTSTKQNPILHRMWASFGRDLVKTTNQEILRRPKSGRVYLIRLKNGTRRRHVASAPGETHANMSGTLRKSLGYKVKGIERMDFGYGASNKVVPKHAIFVEKGTKNMKARPSLLNGHKAVIGRLNSHFEEAVRHNIKLQTKRAST